MSSHLGERAAALVDGQLSPEAAERATAHLAGCRPCRDVVDLERLTKARLASLAGPEPSGDLMGRLLALGGPSGPLPPRAGHVPGTPRPKPVSLSHAPRSRPPAPSGPVGPGQPGPGQPGAGRSTGSGPGRVPASAASRRRRVRLASAVLGALGVVGAGVGGLVLTASGGAPGAGSAADQLGVQQPAPTSSATGSGAAPAATPTDDDRGRRIVPAAAPNLPLHFRHQLP